MKMRADQDFVIWLNTIATEDEKNLIDKIYDFSEMFEDMLFANGTDSYFLMQYQAKINGEWRNVSDSLRDELEYFNYGWFNYKVEPLEEGVGGCFNLEEMLLCVPPNAEDHTILHEMIHLHEFVINDLPMYYHDMLYWALYQNLRKKIDGLDDVISDHAHIVTQSGLYSQGGLHDILFLLKSFDLDIRQGYPLGTVFGYGRIDDFKNITYTK